MKVGDWPSLLPGNEVAASTGVRYLNPPLLLEVCERKERQEREAGRRQREGHMTGRTPVQGN